MIHKREKLSEMTIKDFNKMVNKNRKEAFNNFRSYNSKRKEPLILSSNAGELGLCGINQYINYLILNQHILYNAKISNNGFFNTGLVAGMKMVIQAHNDLKRFKKSQSKKNRTRVMNDLKTFGEIYKKDLIGRILVAMSIKRIDKRKLTSFMQDTDNPHVFAELDRSLICANPFVNIFGYLCMEKPIFANSNNTHINHKYFYENKANYLENMHDVKRITVRYARAYFLY